MLLFIHDTKRREQDVRLSSLPTFCNTYTNPLHTDPPLLLETSYHNRASGRKGVIIEFKSTIKKKKLPREEKCNPRVCTDVSFFFDIF